MQRQAETRLIMAITFAAALDVHSDGPITITLDGCGPKGRHLYQGTR